METTQHYRAMEAFCRQHAKMDGESDAFWLAQAEVLRKLAVNAQKAESSDASEHGERKKLPDLGA
jgi:hypothetical protein